MFTGGNKAFQKDRMEPTNIRVSINSATTLVTCDEDVYTKYFVRGKKRVGDKFSNNGMELVFNKLISSNMFRKVGGRWYMIHHHATEEGAKCSSGDLWNQGKTIEFKFNNRLL
jgi:hypothetical protein